MVGGGRRGGAADEVKLNTGNVFAALESLKKKKKGDKGKAAGSSSSRKKHGDGAAQQQEPPQKEVFWAPAPLTTKSWADVEDDDDDDYFATTAPPRPVWGTAGQGDEAGKDEEDVEAAVRAALQEVYFPSSSMRLYLGDEMCLEMC
jgi:hypothetical protein